MLTLALDTSTRVCTVGLVQDGHVLAEYDISVGLTHSEGLMPQLNQMFARTGIKKENTRFFYGTAYRAGSGGSDGLCLAVWYLWCQYVAGYGL